MSNFKMIKHFETYIYKFEKQAIAIDDISSIITRFVNSHTKTIDILFTFYDQNKHDHLKIEMDDIALDKDKIKMCKNKYEEKEYYNAFYENYAFEKIDNYLLCYFSKYFDPARFAGIMQLSRIHMKISFGDDEYTVINIIFD